jgi:hypothetical protein
MYVNFMSPAVVDMSGTADTAAFTWTTTKAGTILANAIFGILEEAVASGGFTSTAGDYTVKVGSYIIATWSTGTTATARAIGYQANATPSTTYCPDGSYKFAAGDTITISNDSQGAGGTTTGTVRVYLPVEFDAD